MALLREVKPKLRLRRKTVQLQNFIESNLFANILNNTLTRIFNRQKQGFICFMTTLKRLSSILIFATSGQIVAQDCTQLGLHFRLSWGIDNPRRRVQAEHISWS